MTSRTPLIFFILILLCFSIYFNSLNNAFISDDISAIVDNPHISQPLYYWLQPNNFLNSLGYLIQGYNPFIQHLINIILHSLNTILVFFFLCLFFKPDASLLGACIFATHPIHTEAVTWVSGRCYLILAFFILTTYLLYYHSTNPSNNKRRKAILYALSLAVFSYFTINNIGFFSLTPFLLILSDITFNKWRKTWKLWIPFLGIVILRLFLARNAILERNIYIATEAGQRVIWSNPISNLAYSFFTHMGLLLWPANLTLYHEPAIIHPSGLRIEVFSLPLLLLAISIFFLSRRAKELFFALGIFVLFLVPTYSPVQVIYTVAERYLYFPSIALSMAMAFGYENYVSRKQGRFNKYLLVILISLILACGIRTIIRNQDWKVPVIFWKKTVAVSPKSVQAHNGLALTYFKEGDVKNAIKHYSKAIEINPKFAKAYNNRGVAYKYLGGFKQALSDYNKAIKINPNLAEAYNNRGNIYRKQGNINQALQDYNKAIEINPNFAEAYNNRAVVHFEMQEYNKSWEDAHKAGSLGYKVNPEFLKLLEPYRKR